MPRVIDLKGQRFGRLNVIDRAGNNKHRAALWMCKCDCGKKVNVASNRLRSRSTLSCGCLQRDKAAEIGQRSLTHGMSNTPEYSAWNQMIQRCTNPSLRSYEDYGGRGISVCSEWRESFDQFYADMGPRPSVIHSIERKDVNGNYRPENCVWALPDEQSRNRRVLASNISGQTGVAWCPKPNKWRSTIRVNYHIKHLGYFADLSEAIQARRNAEIKYWGKIYSNQ
jgi:hypothetical protein